MIVLHWIFTNGHAWSKEFDSVEHAENYADLCGFFASPTIERAWIETPNNAVWLKEKQRGNE